jgi:hypothetical protein
MPEQLQPDESQEVVDPANPIGNYRIKLDGRWLFEELSELPHIYLQAYGFFAEIESIVGIDNILREPEGAVRHPLEIELINPVDMRRFNYPWAGGWSSTNFYTSLVRNLRFDAVPKLLQIQFASPGFIELSLWLAAAAGVRRCINETAKTASIVHKTYDEIHSGMARRKLLAFDVRKKQLELTREELAFAKESRQQLSDALGLTAEEGKAVTQLSPGTADEASAENELGTVKVLLSLTRRIMGLSKFEEDGKAKF